jgi:hypothetical protein
MVWRLCVVATMAAAWPVCAQAQTRCVRILGWRSGDCPAEVERAPDRAEGAFWRDRKRERGPADRLTGPVVPGAGPSRFGFLPPPAGPTREGPLSIDDLRLRPDGQGGYRGQRPGYRFDIERDGTIHFQDPPPLTPAAFVGLTFAAVFDLTDLVMRAAGMDPYSYDKGRIVDLTRGMREQMGAVERPRRIASALARLPGELEALWRRSDLTAAERRATLFQLWDDLLEGPVPGASDAELEAAAQARIQLVRFVQRRLPSGTPDAYRSDELERLNARRRSRLVFAPYASP